MNLLVRLFAAALLACVFASAVIGLEIGLVAIIEAVTEHRIIPRGLGWVVVPIMAAIAGWKAGYQIDDLKPFWLVASTWLKETQLGRATIIVVSLWVLGWTYYAFNTSAFEEYEAWPDDVYFGWSISNWLKYLEGLFGLPILWVVGLTAFSWVKRGRSSL